MGKRKRTDSSPAETAQPQQRSWLPAIIAGVLAGTLAAGVTYALAVQPKPLGVPIPPPPRPIFKLVKAASKESSVIRRELPVGWLGRLAPQPDGLPYLHDHYHSDKLGFDISYPYGIENVVFGRDTFDSDFVDSQGKVRIDQPLAAIKVSLPSNEGKKQLEYAKRLIEDAMKAGAKPVESPREVKLPGGTFATVAYRRSEADNNYVHRLYCAVVAKRILIFDFFIRPETPDDGKGYAEKIMRSFQPGTLIGPVMEQPAPQQQEEKPTTVPAPTPAH